MSAYIYCLYSTEDGVPRYIDKANDKVSYSFKQHIVAALEKEPGDLNDWMRDVWRSGFDVAVYTLQESIAPADVDMFEQYWIGQFANLKNIGSRETPNKDSQIAGQVIAAILAQLQRARQPPHA